MFDFSSAMARCEKIVADTLGRIATLTSALGEVTPNVSVMLKTYDQVMGDEGQWSGRYAQSLGNGTASSHFISIPISIDDDFESGRCEMSDGEVYAIGELIGIDNGFNVYSAIAI